MRAVHEAVEAAVSSPVDGVLLLKRVQARRASRRRGAVVGSLVAVAALVLGVSTLPGDNHSRVTKPEPRSATQTVSYRGVQVTVPSSWRLGAASCGTPLEDTVLLPQASWDLCGVPRDPVVTWVQFQGATYRKGQHHTTVSGTAALSYFETHLGEQPAYAFGTTTIPATNVTVFVQGPDPSRVRALLSTVRRIAVDENGCPTKYDDNGPAPRTDASQGLVPAVPTSMSLCRYDHYRIEHSVRLDASQLIPLQEASNELVEGTTPALHQSGCPAQIGGIYVLRARYAIGPDVEVTTKPFSCEGRSPTNGSRTTTLTVDYVALLDQTLLRRQPNAPGRVTGVFEAVGGPVQGFAYGLVGTVTFTRGSSQISTTSEQDGHFQLTLPPGTYTVSGTSPMINGGESPCRRPERLKVTRDGAGNVRVICSIK